MVEGVGFENGWMGEEGRKEGMHKKAGPCQYTTETQHRVEPIRKECWPAPAARTSEKPAMVM